LGITGTFLGDYFGILMKEKVTGFPFNITNDPMYNGSSLLFLADAIAYILHTNQTNNQSTKREDFSML
jgi:methylene-fatty-acyl-phospholipid synthase